MRERTGVVGVVALVAVNAALVPMALWTTRDGTDPGQYAAATARIVPRPQAMPTIEPPTVIPAKPAAVLDTGDGIAVQATPGWCHGPASALSLSLDGGRNWRALAAPTREVLRIIIASRNHIWLVGTDPACREHSFSSSDQGKTWRILPSTGTWHRLTDAAAPRIQTPRGPVPSPCRGPVAEVTASNWSIGAVRCGDGSLHRTNDRGHTWSAVAAGGGAVRALAFAGSGRLYTVSTGDAGCGGWRVSLRLTDTWRPLGCVPGDAETAPAVTLSFEDPEAGLLVIGAATYATADGGRVWERRDRPVDNHRPGTYKRSI